MPKGISALVGLETLYGIVVRLESKRAVDTIESLKKIMKALPDELKKSITFDNGTEFTNHQELLEELGIKTLFNPFYEVSGMALALWLVQKELKERFIFLYSDVLFDPKIITYLLTKRCERHHN